MYFFFLRVVNLFEETISKIVALKKKYLNIFLKTIPSLKIK